MDLQKFLCSTLRSITAIYTSLPSLIGQNYIGVWLDRNCNQMTYAPIKEAFQNIFDSFSPFVDFTKCIIYINEHHPTKIFLIISHDIGKNLIPLILDGNTSTIEHIYIHCTEVNEQKHWNTEQPDQIRGGYIGLQDLLKKIKEDIFAFNVPTATTMPLTTSSITPLANIFKDTTDTIHSPACYAVPPTMHLDSNIKNNSIKDLSKDDVWFIQFQLLVEIIIRFHKSENATRDMIYICQNYYSGDECAQRQIKDFEKEANNLSRIIYWYTTGSFLVHMLNKVCGTEDVDHLYYFRLVISNLHERILQLQNVTSTNNLKERYTTLYRGKRMAASTLENLRKNIGNMVAMKGFLSTTGDEEVAKMFADDPTEQSGSVCVLFQLTILNWETCKPSAVIGLGEGCMKDEKEVLFSIGSIWKIEKVYKRSGKDIL